MDCVFWPLCAGFVLLYDLCLLGLQKLLPWIAYEGCLFPLLPAALLGLCLFGRGSLPNVRTVLSTGATVWMLCLLSYGLMLVQGSLFPFIVLFQQSCLAYGLFKGACSLYFLFSKLVLLMICSRDFVPFFLYCWSPAYF
jgi:hypothetical protein